MVLGEFINKPSLTILTMLETIRVSSRGQIVIPENIRKHFQIKEGTKLILVEKQNKIVLEKEEDFLKEIEEIERERLGWLLVAEKSMAKMWDNPKDEEEWKKYL